MASGEQWRAVADQPGYEVSDRGALRHGSALLRPSDNGRGYLRFNFPGRTRKVHHVVFEAFVGERPPGRLVRHLNDVKVDNRVENLALGGKSENALDAVRNGKHGQASKTQCPNGHPLIGDNLVPRKDGGRECRVCHRATGRKADMKRRTKGSK